MFADATKHQSVVYIIITGLGCFVVKTEEHASIFGCIYIYICIYTLQLITPKHSLLQNTLVTVNLLLFYL